MTTTQEQKPQSDASRIAGEMIALSTAAVAPITKGDAHFMVVPNNCQHIDITQTVEKARPSPSRKRGTIHVKDLDSLLMAISDNDGPSTYVFADPDSTTITAVFNDTRAKEGGWRDHRATYKAEHTPEFLRWIANNGQGKAKGQSEFAEFIEDNLADIQDNAQQLLEVATTIEATSGIEFKSSKRLENGQVQLTYNEVIDARAGSSGSLSIPKEFTLGLRIFKNGEGYKLKARLKYRLNGGLVKFWYELDRPERAVEDAFAGYVAKVRELHGNKLLIGSPD